MKNRATLFVLKLKVSARTIAWVLRQWRYALIGVVGAAMFFELVYWLFNVSLFSAIMSGHLTLLEKLQFLMSPFVTIGQSNGAIVAILMVALAILQGLTIALLVYTVRRQRKFDMAAVGSGSFVGLLAMVGLGCPACGTSLITPVVALFVSGSAVSISESITLISLPLAILIAVYGMYTLGVRAAGARMRHESARVDL